MNNISLGVYWFREGEIIPRVCTFLSDRSLQVLGQTSPLCSNKTKKKMFSQHTIKQIAVSYTMMSHQNLLDFNWSGFGLVQDHFLCNFFFPLHPVQFVIRVTIQYRPS